MVLLVVVTSTWLMYQERLAAGIQTTRLLAVERRELIASHLERTVERLTRIAAQLATDAAASVPPDPDLLGLQVLGLDGAVRATPVDAGAPPGGAAEVAAGASSWRALALAKLPTGQRALRLVGPLKANDAPATGVLVALVDTARLLQLLGKPVDRHIVPAASLCAKHGDVLDRLDTPAGQAIPEAEIRRALGGEEAAVLRTGADGHEFVISQQRVGLGTWAVVLRATLADSLPASSFPPHLSIPMLVLLGLAAVLLRQPTRAPSGVTADSLGIAAPTKPPAAGPPAPPARPGSEVVVLNRGRLELLRKAVGTDVMTELVSSFTGNLPKRIAAVRTALEQNDAEAVAARGHSLYGSAANLGLDRLSAIGHWLDSHGRSVRTSDLAAAVQLMEAEADAGLRALNTFVAEQPAELDRCLGGMADLYVRVDDALLIRAHSGAAGRDAALTAWMAEGRSFVDSAAPADRPRLREALELARTAPRRELIEVGLATGAGRIAWSLCRAPGGAGVLAFGRDAAARNADNAALAAQRDEAVAALHARSDFLAAVTHELRTPLNAVIGMTGLLLATELSGEQKDCAQVVRLGAENLLALVNDILDFSKIEAGKLELETISFDLLGAVEDVIDLLALKATQRKVKLVVESAEGLPGVVRGDQGRLRQILTNLTDNALKFSAEGSAVTIRLRKVTPPSGTPASLIRCEVQDTGTGIPESALGRLFQPFTQADASTTRRYGGTGLGLAICRQLVTLMGGTIGVDSRVGKGSTFWFLVPLPEGTEAEVAAHEELRLSSVPLEPMPFPLRALVVDDNAFNQLVATRILERLNVKTDVAGSGREALQMLQLLPYDMIFMDFQMPDMDGPEATRQIRKLLVGGTRIPIIGLTADAQAATREACLAVGMDDFLAKPVMPGTLRAAVARWAPEQPRVSWRDATTGAAEAMKGIFADTPSTGQHFDRSRFRQIKDLARQHTDSFFLNVVEVYLTSTRSNLDVLKRAMAAGKRDAAGDAAVALHRASEHMGAVVLAEECRAFVEQVRAGGDLGPILAQIEREIEAIAGVLTPRK